MPPTNWQSVGPRTPSWRLVHKPADRPDQCHRAALARTLMAISVRANAAR
jgi:hypothetical protein